MGILRHYHFAMVQTSCFNLLELSKLCWIELGIYSKLRSFIFDPIGRTKMSITPEIYTKTKHSGDGATTLWVRHPSLVDNIALIHCIWIFQTSTIYNFLKIYTPYIPKNIYCELTSNHNHKQWNKIKWMQNYNLQQEIYYDKIKLCVEVCGRNFCSILRENPKMMRKLFFKTKQSDWF